MGQHTHLSLLPLQSWVLMIFSTQQIPHLWLYPYTPTHTQIPLLFPSCNYSAVRGISVPLSFLPFVAPFIELELHPTFFTLTYNSLSVSSLETIPSQSCSFSESEEERSIRPLSYLSLECLPTTAPLTKQLKPASSQSPGWSTRLTCIFLALGKN